MNFFKGLVLSAFIHALIFGMLYGYVEWRKVNEFSAIDIDLKHSSLIIKPANALKGANQYRPEEIWFLQSTKHLGAAPKQAVKIPEKTQESATVECPPPCPLNPNDWVAASAASYRPEWISGMITDADYPQTARKEGVEGSVKAVVLIDSSGNVQKVEIIDSSDPRFAAVVQEKLKTAKFKPALDSQGRPINVRMVLPIIFKLQ